MTHEEETELRRLRKDVKALTRERDSLMITIGELQKNLKKSERDCEDYEKMYRKAVSDISDFGRKYGV